MSVDSDIDYMDKMFEAMEDKKVRQIAFVKKLDQGKKDFPELFERDFHWRLACVASIALNFILVCVLIGSMTS